jgi:hypothetical protein
VWKEGAGNMPDELEDRPMMDTKLTMSDAIWLWQLSGYLRAQSLAETDNRLSGMDVRFSEQCVDIGNKIRFLVNNV